MLDQIAQRFDQRRQRDHDDAREFAPAKGLVGENARGNRADEPFGWRELTGVVMITLAALIEPLRDLIQHRRNSQFIDYENENDRS